MAKTTKKLTLKQRAWLRAFLDPSNPSTYFNRARSAQAAGYRCNSYEAFGSMGHQNFKKLEPLIDQWIEENGLSDTALKAKLLELIDAKETKFIKVKGAINPEDLLPGFTIVGTTGAIEEGKDGKFYGDGDTVLMVQMDALEIQRKSLDMGFKVKGVYETLPIKDVTIIARVSAE